MSAGPGTGSGPGPGSGTELGPGLGPGLESGSGPGPAPVPALGPGPGPGPGLPFLPGCAVRDPTRTSFHRSHTLGFRNGYAFSQLPREGIGGETIFPNLLSQDQLDDLCTKGPTLTYGPAKKSPPPPFMPSYVAFDKQVLKFDAYFKEEVLTSAEEHYRIRQVGIYYYLEDDSMCVIEPVVKNSGLIQGKLMRRHRVPKNDQGDYYHWKDLNLATNITMYGRTYRLVDCDSFTKVFMESQGIVLNPPEQLVSDPYIEQRRTPVQKPIVPAGPDPLWQFLTYDTKVLRFYAIWDDTNHPFGDQHRCIIHYFLADDTVEVREVYSRNDGRDPFPVLMKRQRLPKTLAEKKMGFPSCVLEITNEEVLEWYSPRDFAIGKTITLLGRTFLIYDCDKFTQNFYREKFGITDFQPLQISEKPLEKVPQVIPPHNGFGMPEDSLQNCLRLIPKRPQKDVIKMLENDLKVLRYQAALESPVPEDRNRRFILSYFLSDDTISIYEPPIQNSGIPGGKYLKRTRVAKPGSTPEDPIYFQPSDFTIGSTIEVFGHRFVITDADEYVLNYLERNAESFPATTLQSLRDHFRPRKAVKDTVNNDIPKQALDDLIEEVQKELKLRHSYLNTRRFHEAFHQCDKDGSGIMDKGIFLDLCDRLEVPTSTILLKKLIDYCSCGEDYVNYRDFLRAFPSNLFPEPEAQDEQLNTQVT
ncbi:EF-hand domain-containing protein 1 [Pipra filicauda]|uniref:EF-hand domain-containing protein 1 n=1 Tax=Pipra filicauda TaxID=649802 RepID=A0A6J2I3M9_9PASS|nr:EF-hand domain-containing protein 1 [Pipra filicauda]